MLRAARALAADGALLSPACCDPLYRKAIRVSMGAALHLPWARVADWDATLARVRAAGFQHFLTRLFHIPAMAWSR